MALITCSECSKTVSDKAPYCPHCGAPQGQENSWSAYGVLVYCHCGHHVALDADHWPDKVRLSDLEPRFVCQGCGSRGADVRPDFDWNAKAPFGGLGYR